MSFRVSDLVAQGIIQGNSAYATIFYDSANTGYYVDPASNSNIYQLTVNGDHQSGYGIVRVTSSNDALLSLYTGNNATAGLRLQNSSSLDLIFVGKKSGSTDFVVDFGFVGSSEEFIVDSSGNTFSRTSSRAPIFYDSNDTSFFGDFAGRSMMNKIEVSRNGSYGSYLDADLIVGSGAHDRRGYGQTGGSNIMLRSSAKSTITALDESQNLGQISYENLVWTIGEDIGWGNQKAYFPGDVGVGVSPISKLHVQAAVPSGVGGSPAGTIITVDNSGNNFITFRHSADNGTYAGLAFLDNNIGGYVVFGNSGANPSDSMAIAGYNGGVLQYGTANSVNPAARTTVVSWNSTGLQVNNGDLRASIFYDINDTSYYVDPNSTSRLNILTTAYLNGHYTNTSAYNSSNTLIATPSGIRSQAAFITFTDGNAIAPYAMYRTSGDWPAPYGIGWGTGGESSGIFQQYASNNYSLGDMTFYINNDGAGRFKWVMGGWEGTTYNPSGSNNYNNAVMTLDNSGNLQASASMRAPIFYDSNDTNYYVDPNSTSKQWQLTNAGALGTSASNARNHFTQYNSGTTTPAGGWIAAAFGDNTNNRVVIGQWNGNTGAIIGGHTPNLDDWSGLSYVARNHQFYANADYTGTVSMLLDASHNLTLRGKYSTTAASSRFGNVLVGDGTYKNSITPISDTNLNISTPSGAVYFDTYGIATGSFRAPIFYDSDNTSYYGDFAGTSNFNGLNVGGSPVLTTGNWTSTIGPNPLGYYGATPYTWTGSQILYYWTKIANISNVGDSQFTIEISGKNDVNYVPYVLAIASISAWNNSTQSLKLDTISSYDRTVKIAIDNSGDVWLYGQFEWSSYLRWRVIEKYGSPTIYTGSFTQQTTQPANSVVIEPGQQVRGNQGSMSSASVGLNSNRVGSLDSIGDIYAPRFYDRDNTSYYLDPGGTSILNGLTVGGSSVVTNNGGTWGISITGSANTLDGLDSTDFMRNYGMLNNTDVYVNFRVMRNNNSSSPNDGMYIGYGNTNGGITRIFGGGATSGELIKYSNYTYEPGSFRAPIFYDSQDTTYYLDPASTVTSLNVAGNITMGVGRPDSTIIMGDNDQGNRSIHCNSDRIGFLTQGGNWGAYLDDGANWYADGSMRAPIFYDSNDTTYYADFNNTGRSIYTAGYLQSDRLIMKGSSGGGQIYPTISYGGVSLYGGDQLTNGAYFTVTGIDYGSSPGAGSAEFVIRSTATSKFALFSYNGSTWTGRYGLFGSTGNVTIGDASTDIGYRLYVIGDIYATGNVIAYSDARVKTNIREIENPLARVLNTRGVMYDRTDNEEKDNVGFIAQELEKEFPELISTSTDGRKGVKYQNMVAVLIEAMKEQNKEIQKLKMLINGTTKHGDNKYQ